MKTRGFKNREKILEEFQASKPITVLAGNLKIVDGNLRYQVALKLGIKPDLEFKA